MSGPDIVALAKRVYRAYETKERVVVETMLADDFTFTSPRDDHIGKARYLERCWPNSEVIQAFRFEQICPDGDSVMLRFEAGRPTASVSAASSILPSAASSWSPWKFSSGCRPTKRRRNRSIQ